jgi:GATA-binding protein
MLRHALIEYNRSYKLHGSARPISMKSDVIRKRSRHDARRAGAAAPETPSASPGASRRTSPTIEPSPTLAPDSTTQMTYEYNSESEYRVSPSELSGALGCQEPSQNHFSSPNSFPNIFGLNVFPGPYHPDILQQQLQYGTNGGGGAGNGNGMMVNDPLPFASMDSAEIESVATPSRSTKRRRMSTDSAEDPPSSAVSFSSYNDGYSSASSATSLSQRSSMEFPYSSYTSSFGILRGSGNTFWHPPMMPASQDRSPQFVHPPMLPPVTSNCGPGSAGGAEESPMDYLHPPMVLQDEESLFSAYLHPPMVLTEEPLSQQPQQTQQQQQQQQQQSKQQQQRSPPAVASALQPHPPMFPNDSIFHAAGSELYDSAMHAF